jgi:hypothetical protein
MPPTSSSAYLHLDLARWRDEAVRAGRRITRIAIAFEAGHDGFWLARWLRTGGLDKSFQTGRERSLAGRRVST